MHSQLLVASFRYYKTSVSRDTKPLMLNLIFNITENDPAAQNTDSREIAFDTFLVVPACAPLAIGDKHHRPHYD